MCEGSKAREINDKLQLILSETKIDEILRKLRVLVSNDRSNQTIMKITKEAIKKFTKMGNHKGLVDLYGLLILQLEHLNENADNVSVLIEKMQKTAEKHQYKEGLALTYSYLWYNEKLKGNSKASREAIFKAKEIIDNLKECENYNYYFVIYSFAMDRWLEKHDTSVISLLEDCIQYYYKNNFHRSLAQTFSFLSIIYTRKHKNKRILKLGNEILANRTLFEKLPPDVEGIIYYFTGLGHMLDANLVMAESYFNEAYDILKPIYKSSIYFSNFLILHSYLATVKGLHGKTDQAYSFIKEAENILQSDFIKTNLDENTEKQIVHTLNLVKFYNISRLGKYSPQEHQVLINEIIENCKDLYSDFMTLSEFILNSNLDSDKLQLLLSIDNFSINRVKHLIEFMLEMQRLDTEISQEQKALNCISILKSRVITSKIIFMENVYADLLIAQQLFTLKRYAEISPLLKKYENRLKKIEVLEMRIFMEAFIQVGAFKSGDLLGPALQYMAIKKCRLYGFSRLENTLLRYLQLQHKVITRAN
ncbi:MAG: hypothetical protein KGD64_01585 [Candidatus Heimdallarchaeota archaeon]|nr:hypothetical protein [Candidatus Heimdallarchaeota archaeon]